MSPFQGNRNHPLRESVGALADELIEVERNQLRYHVTDDRIDLLALEVAGLPRYLTVAQAQRLRIIARELNRRSR